MQTKISVIITCYNGFRYMNRCWDALEHQTYRKFKVIVVDDCSTDDTLYQLYNYQSHSALDIFVIHNITNQKLAKSRHIGVAAADTQWIAFCDCDDWYEYDFLEKMLKKAEATKAEMVMCNLNYAYSNGTKKRLTTIDRLTDNSTHKEFIAYTPMSLCRFILKKELYSGLVIPDINNAEDGAVTPQLVAKCKIIGTINEGLYNYFIRCDSLSLMPNPNIYKDFILAQKVVDNTIGSYYPEECEFIGIKNICYGAVLNSFKSGVSLKEIKDFSHEFFCAHPNWSRNPYLASLKKEKRLFLLLLRLKAYILLFLYSRIHQYIVCRNITN